jgi:sugar phosphate isomerase/epimerase
MRLSLSTRWNAHKSPSGEEMLEEILALGFDSVELGYDLTLDLTSGVRAMLRKGNISVGSTHNFCPVPIGAPYGHPEIFSLASPDDSIRKSAVRYTRETIEFAVEVGAKAVVAHAGNVDMTHFTAKLIEMAEKGKISSDRYEKTKLKLMMKREKLVPKYLECLKRSLEELLPSLEKGNIKLALENLPSWESIPSETEMLQILQDINSPFIGWWYDIGHGQVRENLGLISQKLWLEKLGSHIVGFHVHDVQRPATDHIMPPDGDVDFSTYKQYITPETLLVLEPAPGTPASNIVRATKHLQETWDLS